MSILKSFMATPVLAMLSMAPAKAVTYEYIGAPLVSDIGSHSLIGHPIIFQFSTYNILAPNLSFDRTELIDFGTNVPIINWSTSVGAYQGSGAGRPAFVFFATNPNGSITDWFFSANPVSPDGTSLVVVSGTDQYGSLLGPYNDLAQVSSNISFEVAINRTLGNWLLIDPTPIHDPNAVAVPGPIVGAGLPGLLMAIAGFIGWRRNRLMSAWRG